MFRLIWAVGDGCTVCGRRQPLGIENGRAELTARCLSCGARFVVELTNQGDGTRAALIRLTQSVLATSQLMLEVNRQTDIVLHRMKDERKEDG